MARARNPEMPGAPAPTPQMPDLARNIINIEKATYRLLPSTVSGVLAQSGLSPEELKRASRLIAMNFDLSPAYLGWGTTAAPEDPYTGKPLSLSTFRRMTQDVKPEILQAMAPALFQPSGSDERAAERPWVASANAASLSRHIRAFGPVLAEYHPFAHEAIGLALELAKRAIPADKYAANLQTVIKWYKFDRATLMQGREMDWFDLAALAMEATQAKQTLRSSLDVRAFLFPALGKVAEEGRKAQAAARANADASQSNAMYGGGRGVNWLATGVAELTPAATAIITGDFDNPELQAELSKRFGNSDERKAAKEKIRQQAEVEQQRLKLQVMGIGGTVDDVEGLDEAYAILSDPNGDVFKATQLIQKDIINDQEAWSRSFVGSSVNKIVGALEWQIEKIDQLPVWLQEQYFVTLPEALPKELAGFVDWAKVSQDKARFDWMYRQIASGRSLGSVWADYMGIPTWIGSVAGFLYQVGMDPFVILGKGLKIYRNAKTLSGLAETTKLSESVLKKIPLFEERFAIRDKLAQEAHHNRFFGRARFTAEQRAPGLAKALASGEPGKIIEWNRQWGLHTSVGPAYDEPFLLKAQQEYVARFGRDVITQQSTIESRTLLMAMHDMRPPAPGTIAEAAMRSRRFDVDMTRRALDDLGELDGKLALPDAVGEVTARDLGNALLDDAVEVNPMLVEIPYYRYVANPRRRLGEMFNEALPKTGSSIRQNLGINPGPIVNVNTDVGRWARLTANRASEFTPGEVDAIVAKVQLAKASANPEKAIEQAIKEEIITPVLARAAKRKGLPEVLLPQMQEDIERVFGRPRRQAFAIRDDQVFGTRPVLETQRVNELVFPDVIQIKKFVDAYANTYNDFLKNAPEELSKIIAAGGSLRPSPGVLDRTTEMIGKNVVRPMVGIWKTITVPRPGYALRVIGLDEGLGRWTSTGYGLFERLGASQLDKAIEQAVNVVGKGVSTSLGVAAVGAASFGEMRIAAELAAAAAASGGIALRPVRQAVARAAAKPIDALLDAYYPVETFRFSSPLGDSLIQLERPSVSILGDPFANTASRPREAMEQAMRDAGSINSRYRLTDDWGRVTPKDPHYYEILQTQLNSTLGFSTPGKRALRAVENGMSLAETKADLLKWAKTPEGRSMLQQMNWTVEQFDDWADLLSGMAHSYTAGNRQLARLAYHREITETDLRKIPKGALPDIHGPLVQDAALAGNANPLRRMVEFWYDTWVQSPENILNRQPYYKAAKRRAERAYLRLAEDIPNVDVKALKVSVDKASREFALKQVKRIMFDFSENSRLGELLYAVYPFLQPYMEAFSVYGYILAHRNPAVPVYAWHLWDLGKDTGFLRKDKQSGEWVIPTSAIAAGTLALSQFADMPGAQLLTPVQALSLWSNSGFKLPSSFPLIGGATVPAPSFSPFAMLAAQALFGDTRSDALASYLFAYGRNVQILPSAMQKLLYSFFPEMLDDGVLESIAMDYIIEYQYRGIHQELANEKPKDEVKFETALEEQAYHDARQHMLMRAYLAFNGVGATMYRWEWAPIRQEYFDLIDKYGGDTQKAREEFLTKYPAYGAMTVGKTIPGPVATGWLDEDNNILPGSAGLRIPATEYARRVLNSPQGEELLRRFGPMVASLLMQADPAVSENDFATSSQFLAEGLTKFKSISDFIMDVEQAGLAGEDPAIVEEHEGFWGAITSFYENKAGLEEGLRARGFREGSAEFLELDAQEQEFLNSLFVYFPRSANAYLDQDAAGEWRFLYGSSGNAEPDAIALAKVRQFASMPQLQGFNVVKGLNYYLDGLDPIRQKMVDAGVRSLRDPGAIELGLDKEYEALTESLDQKGFVEAAYVVNTLLRGVLLSAPNKGEDTLNAWREAGDARYQAYKDFEEKQASLRKQLPGTQFEYQRSEIYNGLTQAMNETYQAHPEVIQAWWDRQSYGERRQYIDGLMSRYVGFMSTFDLHLLGLDVDAATAVQMRQIADMRVEAQKQAFALGSKFDREEAYAPIDQLEKVFIAMNPKFAEVVNAQRTWGYALQHSEYVQGTDQAAALWRNVLRVLASNQIWATQNQLNGVTYDSAANRDAYTARRNSLIALIETYKQQDVKFRSEWESLQTRAQDLLINILMPDNYFDYPLGPVSPRQAA